MKLAFIKKKFSIHGGAERYLQTLIQYLKNAGYEIHVFSNHWTDEEGLIFHKVNILPFGSFLSALTFNINTNSKLKTQNSKLYDCIISLERTTYQDIYRAGEGCHSEWLMIRSGIEPFYKKISFKINPLHIYLLFLEKKLFTNTKRIIANSKMVKEQIIKYYSIPEDRITIIYNGVDLKRFSPENRVKWKDVIRKKFDMAEVERLLLFIGSGFERKGLNTLINAASLIKGEDFKAIVIGKGDADKYKAIAERLGISDKIIFLGIQNEVEKFYAAADLFILPTLYDPFSNATLEAMASGLPVITTKNNGAAELIENGKEGFVIDDFLDSKDLSEKILNSLDNLAIMGKAARQKAEQFPIEKAVREFTYVVKQSSQL
ncbi:MAG: hypothetical protein CVV37_00865 [Nitrospira bacterium HGW-Nitrospira-1]|nr:MAG: hypothetical protein CVV37_00865 [Nitrospira bacterium HGW-Nitrospira-1]